MNKKQVLAISGSIRKNSSNELILKAAAKIFSEEIEVNIYNQLDKLPFFNPDLDNEYADVPETVINFRKLVDNADGVIICTPEYVFSLPGVLKNALEWTVSTTVFTFKPFAFIVASASGEKAFESLNLIMDTLLQRPVGENCKLLIPGGKGKINSEGKLSDTLVLSGVKNVFASLIKEMED